MCGLCGAIAYSSQAVGIDRDSLKIVRDMMSARGPDDAGIWLSDDRRLGLAHRRLSIQDPSFAGHQPMESEDKRYQIAFNGEIYNHKHIRRELEAEGCRFESSSDTEVLLRLFVREGKNMLRRLRGMFAFAIWDEKARRLFLARDPFGMKPLYYADTGSVFWFASQVRALRCVGGVNTAPDPAGHVGFFLWGSVPEPNTLCAGIRALPAGSFMWVTADAGPESPIKFCDLTHEMRRSSTGGRHQGGLGEALRDSVQHHLVSDVPVGVFLSAGLDSGTLLALASEYNAGAPLRTVTLGFQEFRDTPADETGVAKQLAEHYGSQHETRWVSKQDFEAGLDDLLTAMDQPTIDGVNTYWVSRVTAEMGLKVALSGIGGDELFGGYPSFYQIPQLLQITKLFARLPGFGRSLRKLIAPVAARFTSPKYAGLVEYGQDEAAAYMLRRSLFMPWELHDLLEPDLVRQGWEDLQPLERLRETTASLSTPRMRISALETAWYMRNQLLRDADWAGMAHSLEIRLPYADLSLLRASSADCHFGVAPSKSVMASTPRCALPEDVLRRPKTGFGIPVNRWLASSVAGRQYAASTSHRGLRGWARFVYERWCQAR